MSRGKVKKVRLGTWRSESDNGEGGLGAATTMQALLQLSTEFGYWIQHFLKWLDRQNQLLESLMELKKEKHYGIEEEKLEEEFLQNEEVIGKVIKKLARLMAKKMEEMSKDKGEVGGSEKELKE